MRVLELGSYVAPAYAGMLLAEQGHYVEKWARSDDPIHDLHRGDELWSWLNAGKAIELDQKLEWIPGQIEDFQLVIDNIQPEALTRHGIDPKALALAHDVVWVSLRSDTGGRSFDAIAQARSWLEYGVQCPFYVGDTVAGLWMAFKALAVPSGHYVIGHGACLQKLVEGELMFDLPRIPGENAPLDPDVYVVEREQACVEYRGEMIVEPKRDRAWKLEHFPHIDGRIII